MTIGDVHLFKSLTIDSEPILNQVQHKAQNDTVHEYPLRCMGKACHARYFVPHLLNSPYHHYAK